jgi:hypothetical protein
MVTSKLPITACPYRTRSKSIHYVILATDSLFLNGHGNSNQATHRQAQYKFNATPHWLKASIHGSWTRLGDGGQRRIRCLAHWPMPASQGSGKIEFKVTAGHRGPKAFAAHLIDDNLRDDILPLPGRFANLAGS